MQLKSYNKEIINNALDFLQRRRKNHGRDNDDIEVSKEAKEIFDLMKEYGKAIKKFLLITILILHTFLQFLQEKWKME